MASPSDSGSTVVMSVEICLLGYSTSPSSLLCYFVLFVHHITPIIIKFSITASYHVIFSLPLIPTPWGFHFTVISSTVFSSCLLIWLNHFLICPLLNNPNNVLFVASFSWFVNRLYIPLASLSIQVCLFIVFLPNSCSFLSLPFVKHYLLHIFVLD